MADINNVLIDYYAMKKEEEERAKRPESDYNSMGGGKGGGETFYSGRGSNETLSHLKNNYVFHM